MLPRFKALFTDLDGTAIPSHPHGLPSPKVIAAIKKAQKKAYISVATGRPFSMCVDILEQLNITNLCIVEGGTRIINPVTQEIVWEQALSLETMKKISEVCFPYIFEAEKDDAKAEIVTGPTFRGSQRMMVLLSLDEEEAIPLFEKLRQIPEINVLKVHAWNEGKWDLHMSHIGASKRHALEVLLGLLNLEAHEVIGVGDSHNDLPLFEAAGFKVAMGNAIQELKDQADYVAPSVDEDGLADVIEKFILA